MGESYVRSSKTPSSPDRGRWRVRKHATEGLTLNLQAAALPPQSRHSCMSGATAPPNGGSRAHLKLDPSRARRGW